MTSPAPTLDYSNRPNAYRRTHYWLNVALFCGAAPLVAGTIIITLFLTTYYQSLMGAGIVNILVGLVLFVVGVISLVVYRWLSPRMEYRSAWQMKSGPRVALLLLANFPSCWLCIHWARESPVTVVNQTGVAIDSFTFIDWNSNKIEYGSIGMGASRRAWIFPPGGGNLHYTAITSGGMIEGEADIYLDPDDMGHPETVVITAPPPSKGKLSATQP